MHQYYPLSGEYIATGVIGILVYVGIVYLSAVSIFLGIKSKSTKRFFVSVILMGILELPRYLAMAIQGSYVSQAAYCFHILSGIFFFIAFSIVCRQWSGLLQLGSYFRVVYGVHGLIISNVVFAVIDVIAVILCATSSSLQAYFTSTGFEILTFIEGVRNCVYSVFLAYYGVKLVRRFWHFSLLEQQAAAQKRGKVFFGMLRTANDSEGNVFTKVVLRLTSVLLLSTVCFASRLCMLMAKMIALHTSSQLTSPDSALFGLVWFIFADFVPRALPTLAFIFLMRTKRPARDQIKEGNNAAMGDDFGFVRLSTGDEELGGGSRAEAMLKKKDSGSQGDNDETVISLSSMHDHQAAAGNTGTGHSRYEHVGTDNDSEYSDDDGDEDEEGSSAVDRFFSLLAFSGGVGGAGQGRPLGGDQRL